MRVHRRNLPESRALRRASTDAESLLWTVLRARRLGLKWRRQHQIGPWILDLACPEARLAVECDGGGHAQPEDAARDVDRTHWLEKRGWRVVRFWNHEVLHQVEAVLEVIMHEVEVRTAPHPDP